MYLFYGTLFVTHHKYELMRGDVDFRRDTWMGSLPFGTVEDEVLRSVTALTEHRCVDF